VDLCRSRVPMFATCVANSMAAGGVNEDMTELPSVKELQTRVPQDASSDVYPTQGPA
jgi:hypothetical protein